MIVFCELCRVTKLLPKIQVSKRYRSSHSCFILPKNTYKMYRDQEKRYPRNNVHSQNSKLRTRTFETSAEEDPLEFASWIVFYGEESIDGMTDEMCNGLCSLSFQVISHLGLDT